MVIDGEGQDAHASRSPPAKQVLTRSTFSQIKDQITVN